jgi:hypothetical protein
MQHLKPQLVAEAIVYFCAAECQLSGEMFSVGGGRVARVGIVDGTGYQNTELTAEDLAGNIDRARDMNDAALLTSAQDLVARFPIDA